MKQPKPALKKLLLLCAPIALTAVIIGSCKKDNHVTTPPLTNPAAVADAKSWYEKSYPANTKLATQAVSVSQDWSQGVKPDWNNGATYTRFDDDVIEMPVDAAVSGKLNIGLKEQTTGTEYKAANSKSSFLLIKSLGIYHAYIMTVIGDPTYLKGDLTKLDHNKYNKRDSDFAGVVLYSTPKGKFVNAWTYKNGTISGQISPDSASAASTIPGKTQTDAIKTNLTATTTCYTWTQTSSYDGQSTGTIELESYCITSYSGTLDSGGGGGGGSIPVTGTGGGGGGSTTPAPKPPCVPTTAIDNVGKVSVNSVTVNKVQPLPGDPGGGFPPPTGPPCTTVVTSNTIITNNTTNPCLKNMVNATINRNLTTVVNTLIQKVFNTSTKVNLTFSDSMPLDDKIMGYTPPSNFDANGNLNLTVNLNKDKLPNYSQEYIATVIIHESLHAYLTTTNNLGTWQHWNIATTFATQMSVDLQQMFPNLQGPDATNLSWSGLESTDAFQQTIGNDLTAQGNYVATLLAYTSGSKGTKCN
jgi:hypothetical protein